MTRIQSHHVTVWRPSASAAQWSCKKKARIIVDGRSCYLRRFGFFFLSHAGDIERNEAVTRVLLRRPLAAVTARLSVRPPLAVAAPTDALALKLCHLLLLLLLPLSTGCIQASNSTQLTVDKRTSRFLLMSAVAHSFKELHKSLRLLSKTIVSLTF